MATEIDEFAPEELTIKFDHNQWVMFDLQERLTHELDVILVKQGRALHMTTHECVVQGVMDILVKVAREQAAEQKAI